MPKKSGPGPVGSVSYTLLPSLGYVDWSKPRLLRRIAELEKVSAGRSAV